MKEETFSTDSNVFFIFLMLLKLVVAQCCNVAVECGSSRPNLSHICISELWR